MTVTGEQAAVPSNVVPAGSAGQQLSVADFDALFRDRWARMVRLAFLLLGDAMIAEDVVQEAFSNTYRRWSTMTDAAGAAAYVRAAVVNGCRSSQRRRIRLRARPVHEPEGWTDGADAAVLTADRHQQLLTALATLPARQREVIVLRYWEDLSEAELALAMNISRGTVKSTASRALAALLKRLEAQDGN